MNKKIAECIVNDSEFELWINGKKFNIIRYFNGAQQGRLYVDEITEYLSDHEEVGGKYFKALKIFMPIIEKYINLL